MLKFDKKNFFLSERDVNKRSKDLSYNEIAIKYVTCAQNGVSLVSGRYDAFVLPTSNFDGPSAVVTSFIYRIK